MRLSIALALSLVSVCSAIGLDRSSVRTTSFASAEDAPPLPSRDGFYQNPQGWEKKKPGDVLKYRQVSTLITNASLVETAYQVLYRTTAINGDPLSTVTTIFIPPNHRKDRFVSYQFPEDSASSKCAPSYNYRLNAIQTNSIGDSVLEIEAFLQQGYITSSPDYEGPESVFTVGHLAGVLVLDGMRAVFRFGKLLDILTSANPSAVGYGYSGGAIATGWAASLQQKHASDLNIKAFAFGGTPANLTGTTLYIDGGPYSGFNPIGLASVGQPSAYGSAVKDRLNQVLTAEGKAVVNYVKSRCEVDDLINFANKSFLSTEYQTLGKNFYNDPIINKYLTKSLMANKRDETPIVPIHMSHGTTDEIIPYANASHTAATWCKYGASIDFLTVTDGMHVSTATTSFPYALQFLLKAFAGQTPKACSRETIPVVQSS